MKQILTIPDGVNRVVKSIGAAGKHRLHMWNDSHNTLRAMVSEFHPEEFEAISNELKDERKWQQFNNVWIRIPPIVVDRHIEELQQASNNGALTALLQIQLLVNAWLKFSQSKQFGFGVQERGICEGQEQAYQNVFDLLQDHINTLKGNK